MPILVFGALTTAILHYILAVERPHAASFCTIIYLEASLCSFSVIKDNLFRASGNIHLQRRET